MGLSINQTVAVGKGESKIFVKLSYPQVGCDVLFAVTLVFLFDEMGLFFYIPQSLVIFNYSTRKYTLFFSFFSRMNVHNILSIKIYTYNYICSTGFYGVVALVVF